MFDPQNHTHLDRLSRAIDFSRWRLQAFREQRMAMLREIVGAHYSWSGAPRRVPINLLRLALEIYARQLAPQAPRALITPKNPQLTPVAADFEAWSADAIDQMDFETTLRVCAINALLSVGVLKVGVARVGEMDFFGTSVSIGQPFAEAVDLDDWVHDITAKRYDQVQFAGNRYRVSLEEARNNPLYDPQARAKLQAQTRFAYNERGDLRSTTLSQSTMQLYDEYQDHVELYDIWMPQEKLVITVPYQESVEGGFSGVKPLNVVKWTGPAEGPFILLSYLDVPNNIMPAAPLQALVDLHELVNILWRKLARQGERQKTILGVMGTATDDAERINRSNDGDSVRVDFPDRCKELSWGGMRQEGLLAVEQARQLFMTMGGNLESLGGLGIGAPTLGQDELLVKNSSSQITEMQKQTVRFARKGMKHVFEHWWNDPHHTYRSQRSVAGADIPVSITPQMRQIPFEQLGFDIDVYSMQPSTPQGRLQGLMQLVQGVIIPSLPMMAQQGVQLQWPALLQIIKKYGDFPDLDSILQAGPPPEMQGAMEMSHQATQSPVTHRTNTRISRPAMTDKGKSNVMQLLSAGLANRQQANGAMRQTA